jgi:hypothetical protein
MASIPFDVPTAPGKNHRFSAGGRCGSKLGVMPTVDDVRVRRKRKLWQRAKELGLSYDERIELAQYLLRRDVTSWEHLTDDQVVRLLDAVEGYELISQLMSLRL